MASIPVSQYPPAAMIALFSRSTNQSRSPKKRKLPSSSPTPQSIPEPFDHGQQASEFQRVQILQGSEKESRSQDAHGHHQVAPNHNPEQWNTGVAVPTDISSGSEDVKA